MTCCVHAVYVLCTCCVRAVYIVCTYRVHIVYMLCTCWEHALYMLFQQMKRCFILLNSPDTSNPTYIFTTCVCVSQ